MLDLDTLYYPGLHDMTDILHDWLNMFAYEILENDDDNRLFLAYP